MAKTPDIQYIVDEKGRKKSVIMSYKAYKELIEDLCDVQSINERKDEKSNDFNEFVAELK